MMKQIASGITILFLFLVNLSFAQHDRELVLLKNHGGLLPLNTEQQNSIALIGPGYEGVETFIGDNLFVYTAPGINMMNDIKALDSSMVYIGQGVNGFSAKYYNNLKASGSPAKFVTDKYIDFFWGDGIPYPEIDSSAFSVKWDATLIPIHGPIKVKLIHNDGCRLYLDGKLIIDAWKTGPVRVDSAWINIEKGGSYNLQIDYFTDGGPALVKFGFEYIEEFLIQEAVEKARRADVVVYFAKQPFIYEADGQVKKSKSIPKQSKMIRALYEANPNIIVVLQTDTAVDIESWVFDIPAIIQAWSPEHGNEQEIAEVLFGQVNPEGKLPFRWCMNWNQNFDTRFACGFGMTYTTFGIGKLMMKRNRDGSGWTASVEIRNVGDRAGTETLQVFVRPEDAEQNWPEQEVKAIKEVTLFPNQKKTLAIQLPYSAFEYFDKEAEEQNIDAGKYEVLVGTSAEDIKLIKTIELKQLHINQYLEHE